MNIVIAGAGEIGSNLAIKLTDEGHDVTIIESDLDACRKMEFLDAIIVNGRRCEPYWLYPS